MKGPKQVWRNLALKVVGGSIAKMVQDAIDRAIVTGVGRQHPATPRQADQNQGWAFAANRQIGGRASRVPLELVLEQRRESRKPRETPIYDHPFLDLVAEPNPDESGLTYVWRQVLHLQTYGKSYVKVEPEVMDLSALFGKPFILVRPAGLRLLEPERVRVMRSRERHAALFQYHNPLGGTEDYTPAPATRAEREAWKRAPYPFVYRVVLPAADSYEGHPPMEAAQLALDVVNGVTQLTKGLLTNGIHAGLVVYLKKEIEDPERFEKAVLLIKQGLGKAGDPLVLPQKTAEVAENPAKIADMQFPLAYENERDEVLGVLGASRGVVGLGETLNRSVIEGQERILALGTIDPILGLIADGYTTHLLPLYPGQSDASKYKARYPSSAVMDDVTQATINTAYKKAGVLTANEIRKKLGEKPHPDGDSLSTGGGGGGAFGGGDAGGLGGGLELGDGMGDGGSVPEPKSDTAAVQGGKGQKALPAPAGEPEKRSPCGCGGSHAPSRAALPDGHAMADEAVRAEAWRALREARAEAEAALRTQVSDVFRQWRDAVIDELTSDGPRALTREERYARAIGDEDDEGHWRQLLLAAYLAWSVPFMRDRAEQALVGAGFEAGLVDSWLDDAEPAIEMQAARRATPFAKQVTETTYRDLEAVLQDAELTALSKAKAGELVSDVFPVADDSPRLKNIATTEAGIASGRAVGVAMQAAQQGQAAQAAQVESTAAETTPSTTETSTTGTAPAATAETGQAAQASTTTAATSTTTASTVQATQAANAGENVIAPIPVGLLWLSRRDNVVRDDHVIADGQVVAQGELFRVGGCWMRWPGDDETCGDLSEICNCRCEAVLVPLKSAQQKAA